MTITKEAFGNFTDPDTGKTVPVDRYKLCAESGVEVHLLSYGAGICGVLAPDKNGTKENVVLGFDSLDGYLKNPFQGSSIGRFGNRIDSGKFSLDGHAYQLTLNNNGNHLHGGTRGWDKRVWSGSVQQDSVVLSLVTEDGDQGYPGTVMAQVCYKLVPPGRLEIQFRALSSLPTPINMTNHAFFNLAGHSAGREGIVQHSAQLLCDRYLPVSATLIPTGEQRPVTGTGFDLQVPVSVGTALSKVEGGGFDHCFVLQDSNRGTLRLGAKFCHTPSGRGLEVWTTEPAVQFYTGNFIPEAAGVMVGRGGVSYTKQGAFCCEPQNLPDSVNHANFPDTILRPGKLYQHDIVYNFTVAR